MSLDRVEQLLADLGKPQDAIAPVVHVAGTNGKGSTVAFIRAIAEAAGLRVHVYTSPHLVRFNERIRLAGKLIEDDYLAELLARGEAHEPLLSAITVSVTEVRMTPDLRNAKVREFANGFGAFMVLFGMANAGLPGTSGFVGEFMVILAAFQQSPWIGAIAALTLIIGAAYTLWLYKRIFFGEVANSHVAELKDINGREWLVLGVFAIGVLALGIYPKPLTDLMEPSIAKLAMQIASSKLL